MAVTGHEVRGKLFNIPQANPCAVIICSYMHHWSFNRSQGLLVVLLLGLDRGHGDAVQVTLTCLGDPAATLLLVLLKDTNLLESLHDLAVDAAGSVDVVRGTRAAVLGATVNLP